MKYFSKLEDTVTKKTRKNGPENATADIASAPKRGCPPLGKHRLVPCHSVFPCQGLTYSFQRSPPIGNPAYSGNKTLQPERYGRALIVCVFVLPHSM